MSSRLNLHWPEQYVRERSRYTFYDCLMISSSCTAMSRVRFAGEPMMKLFGANTLPGVMSEPGRDEAVVTNLEPLEQDAAHAGKTPVAYRAAMQNHPVTSSPTEGQ